MKCFLSEKFCQDLLEGVFGKQRMRGGYSKNPSVSEFLKATTSLRVQGTQSAGPKGGNCTNESTPVCDTAVISEPLPKRRRVQK